MWTRIYLLLLVVRIFFALTPSYIHPDENFQGPEVVAGFVFALPHHLTWEFTCDTPVRSVFPLWPVYGLPMVVLHWIWSGVGTEEVSPQAVYYTIRFLMFILSFVLEDWAIHELVQSPRHRRLAVILVASSYVTWIYQTHTFSNSIETLVVLWSLVMIQRVLDNKHRSSLLSSAILGSLLTFGVFNRITFPVFVVLPCLYLLPHFARRPSSLFVLSSTTTLTSLLAITIDTIFYNPSVPLFKALSSSPTFTPLNSILYNSQSSNLANHGLHPHYQHLVGSLPLLLGPALGLLVSSPKWNSLQLPLLSALSGMAFLSCIPHQEPRFLLPAVPLILSSIHLPNSKALKRYWLMSWVIFNVVLALLMGIYHQGGVVPAQAWLGQQKGLTSNMSEVIWWRTYSPPIWLLDRNPLKTIDLMGVPLSSLQRQIETSLGPACDPGKIVGLVAPYSSVELETTLTTRDNRLAMKEMWRYSQHLNLDDLDFASDGVWQTLRRVVGRRGLVIWKVRRICTEPGATMMQGDW